MTGIFSGCKNLKSINDLSHFETSNVENMSGMFESCEELEKLNLTKFKTVNVKKYVFDV